MKDLLITERNTLRTITVLQNAVGAGDLSCTCRICGSQTAVEYFNGTLTLGVPVTVTPPIELITIEVTKQGYRGDFTVNTYENLAQSPTTSSLLFYTIVHNQNSYLEFTCSMHSGGAIG